MSEIVERGPFRAFHRKLGSFGVMSEDFTHYVVLHITGDFKDENQRAAYAEEIALRLNQSGQGPMPAEDVEILVYAFRYALGRMTYATATVADRLKRDWNRLPRHTREQIQSDIRQAIANGTAGMEMDARGWSALLDLPIADP